MNLKRLKLLKQLHQIYGNRIDATLNEDSSSPLFLRSCHRDQINRLRNQFSNKN